MAKYLNTLQLSVAIETRLAIAIPFCDAIPKIKSFCNDQYSLVNAIAITCCTQQGSFQGCFWPKLPVKVKQP